MRSDWSVVLHGGCARICPAPNPQMETQASSCPRELTCKPTGTISQSQSARIGFGLTENSLYLDWAIIHFSLYNKAIFFPSSPKALKLSMSAGWEGQPEWECKGIRNPVRAIMRRIINGTYEDKKSALRSIWIWRSKSVSSQAQEGDYGHIPVDRVVPTAANLTGARMHWALKLVQFHSRHLYKYNLIQYNTYNLAQSNSYTPKLFQKI